MSEQDPAAVRFAIIQAVRLSGVAFVIAGMLIVSGRLALPNWAGYPLLAIGLADALVVPSILVRKWRTPK